MLKLNLKSNAELILYAKEQKLFETMAYAAGGIDDDGEIDIIFAVKVRDRVPEMTAETLEIAYPK
jgi:hypothetical protein